MLGELVFEPLKERGSNGRASDAFGRIPAVTERVATSKTPLHLRCLMIHLTDSFESTSSLSIQEPVLNSLLARNTLAPLQLIFFFPSALSTHSITACTTGGAMLKLFISFKSAFVVAFNAVNALSSSPAPLQLLEHAALRYPAPLRPSDHSEYAALRPREW